MAIFRSYHHSLNTGIMEIYCVLMSFKRVLINSMLFMFAIVAVIITKKTVFLFAVEKRWQTVGKEIYILFLRSTLLLTTRSALVWPIQTITNKITDYGRKCLNKSS